MRVGAVLLFLLLAGCATTEAYEKVLQGWIGSHVDDVVRAWGVPQGSHTFKDSSRLIQYVRSRAVAVPRHSARRPVVIAAPGTRTGTRLEFIEEPVIDPRMLAFTCETTFELDKAGIVRKWRWRGNDCVARSE